MSKAGEFHTMRVEVCDSCGVGLINDDWTHLDHDYDDEYSDVVYERCLDWLRFTEITPVGVGKINGYFDCPCCGEIAIGPGHIFDQVIPREEPKWNR